MFLFRSTMGAAISLLRDFSVLLWYYSWNVVTSPNCGSSRLNVRTGRLGGCRLASNALSLDNRGVLEI